MKLRATAQSPGVDEWRGHTSQGIGWTVFRGDCLDVLKELPAAEFHCVVTSPPYYWQRDYKVDGQIGLEASIEGYVSSISDVMDEVCRVLRKDGLLFLNLGDTYYSAKGQPKGPDRKNSARRFGLRAVDASGLGVPRKTTIGVPWRVALEMISRGWILRSPIIWHRANSPPEPTAKDRPWRTYETIFMFSRAPRYYFDRCALGSEEDIWSISERPQKAQGIRTAPFPDELASRCLKVGCPDKGKVLDPFAGSGTVLRVALALGNDAVGIELNSKFCSHIVKKLEAL